MPLNHVSKYSELTDPQFKLIGRLVVEWSNIEFLLGVVLSRLLFTPDFLGRVFTDEIMAARRQSALRKALLIHQNRYGNKILSKEAISELESINAEIESQRGKRNRFSHFCWARSSDEEIFGSGLSGQVPPNKGVGKAHWSVSNQELSALYETSYALVERLSKIVEKLPEVTEEQYLAID